VGRSGESLCKRKSGCERNNHGTGNNVASGQRGGEVASVYGRREGESGGSPMGNERVVISLGSIRRK